jgi:hypothetical protein
MRKGCKTVPMDAGPDDVQLWADLGPISPELVLVDPVLAEQARKLLPDPAPERPRRRPPLPAAEVVAEPVAPPPRRRRGRTVALAAFVFAAGAVSGNLLAERDVPSSAGVTFEAQVGAAPTPSTRTDRATQPLTRRTSTGRTRRTSTRRGPAFRPPVAPTTSRRAPTTAARQRPSRASRVTWAANVLGVTARVSRPGVTIVWKRPASSARVVVLRARGARRRGVVVYRGRATGYRDVSPRPCTAYRYTIVNYDRRGHRSTGVPTSVVTNGCS